MIVLFSCVHIQSETCHASTWVDFDQYRQRYRTTEVIKYLQIILSAWISQYFIVCYKNSSIAKCSNSSVAHRIIEVSRKFALQYDNIRKYSTMTSKRQQKKMAWPPAEVWSPHRSVSLPHRIHTKTTRNLESAFPSWTVKDLSLEWNVPAWKQNSRFPRKAVKLSR